MEMLKQFSGGDKLVITLVIYSVYIYIHILGMYGYSYRSISMSQC